MKLRSILLGFLVAIAPLASLTSIQTPANAQLPIIPGGQLPDLKTILPLLDFIKLSPQDSKSVINAILFYKEYAEPALKIFKAAQSGDLLDLIVKSPEAQGKLGYLDFKVLLAELVKEQQNQENGDLLPPIDTAELSYQKAIADTVFSSGSAFFTKEGQEALHEFKVANNRLSNDTQVLAALCSNENVSQNVFKCSNQIGANQVELGVRSLDLQTSIAHNTAGSNLALGQILKEQNDERQKKESDRREQAVEQYQHLRGGRSFFEPPKDVGGNDSTFPYSPD